MFSDFFSNPLTTAIVVLIGMAFLIGLCCYSANKLSGFREYVPAFMTSLGILGTFIGIVVGLYDFDPEHIDASLPTLLTGLKTAFYTSIAGMTATIAFRLIVSVAFERKTEVSEDAEEADDPAMAILTALKEQNKQMEQLLHAIGSDGDNSVISQTRLLRSEVGDRSRELNAGIIHLNDAIGSDGEGSLLSQIKFLRSDLTDGDKRRASALEQFRIELMKQLDTFIEKMSSSASDQIVEALRQVVQDFNSKLTEKFDQNFKDLNDAVGKMLEWQMEYREQLSLLPRETREVVKSLELSKNAMATIAEKSEAIPATMQNLEALLVAQKTQLEALDANLVAVAEARQRAVEAVPEIQKCISSMIDELKSSVGAVTEEMGSTIKQFNDQTKATNNALLETAQHIQEKSAAIGQSMGTISASVTEAGNNFAIQTQKSIEDMTARLSDMKVALGQTTETTAASVQEVSNQFKTMAEKLVADTLASTQRTMDGSRQQIEQSVSVIAQSTHDQINAQMKHFDEAMTRELNAALSDLGSALATIANTIADRFEDSSKRVSG